MFPARSGKSESRRSSILKPRKPRQPLQNVNFDSSSNDSSPTATKTKRRVSFAEKKHVKEFCHSTEQGTVWDNTYEEHDSSLRGSFADQNAEVELKENASCAPDNDRVHIRSENSSYYSNTACLVNNQLSQFIARDGEEDNDIDCDLDFTNPVKSTELLDASQLGYAALPNKSFTVSIDAASSDIVEYTDEECMELFDKKSQPRQTIITSISCLSKNVESNCIAVYRDSDKETYEDNVVKYNSNSCSNNIDSQLNETHIQEGHLSMDLTEPIPVIFSSCVKEQKEQKRNDINNLNTNYTTNCHNASMEITEAVSIFAEPVASDLEISKQIPTILQNCESTKWDAGSTRNTTNVNYANDSMILTSVIQPFRDTNICHTNNTCFDTSMEMINVSSKICKRNACNENIVKENDLRKDQTDKTEIFNDVPMEMTRPVNILFPNVYNKENFRMDEPSRDDRTMFFHNVSMEMTKAVSTKNKQEIANTNTCRLLSEENAHGGEDVNTSVCFNEGTRILCKSMEFTEAVPDPLCCETTFHNAHVTQFVNKSTCEDHKKDGTEFFNDASMEITKSVNNMLPLNINKENLKIDESKDGKTMFFHNVSMEMTTAVSSRNRNEITQPVTCKSVFKENTYGGKDTNNSTCFNERTRLLCKSMEFTEVVPNSLHGERTFNTTPAAQSSQTFSKTTLLPAENSVRVTDAVTNKTIQDVSMEITTAIPSILQLKQDMKLDEYKENTYKEKDTNNSTCFDERTKLLRKSMEFTEVVPISLHDARTFNTIPAAQSSQTLSKTILLPAENFVRVTDAVTNKTVQDVSMEITTAIPSILQLKQDMKLNEYKENTYREKDTNNSTCFDERTKLLRKSMEFTEVVPISLHDERTFNTIPAAQSSQTLSKTTLLPAENSVRVTDAVINKTIQDVSMEITTTIPSILQFKKDVKLNEYKENTCKGKDTNSSTCFNERTKLLRKSMEFTEVVPISLHDERTFNTTHTMQSSQTLSETTSLPAENSMRITDAVTNKIVQDVSITTADVSLLPSMLQFIQDEKLNETENSIISKNDEFQHLTTNNLAKSNRDTTKENSTISKEIVETENIRHNELSNIIVTQSSLDNLDQSLNANFKNDSNKKRSHASEESYSKRVLTSMEIQSFQENDIHPFPNANTNCINDIKSPECFVKDIVEHTQVSDSNFVNDIECNERFIKDTMDRTQIPDSNLRDSLSEINKHSFLRKSLPYLENSFVELQSIKPPSFVCLDSEEESSSHEIQNELQSSIITDTVNNTSNQLINNVTESKCLKEKVTNIENNQVEDCHRNIIVDNTEDNQETNCQTGTKTIINDNQPDKSNYYTKKNISKENILSMNEKTLTVQDVNHCTSLIIKEIEDTNETDEDQVNEGEHTQKSMNEDVKLQSDIKEKEQYSDKKNQETKQYSDHFEGTVEETVIEEIDSEERRTNLNDEVQQQSIEQKNEYITKTLETAQRISMIEDVKNESLIEQDPFLMLSQKLETHGARDDCIWNVYYKNIDRKMIVFGFMSNSLLIVTFLSYDLNSSEENLIKEIKIISRISDNAGVLIRIVHKLILEKLNAETLTKSYKTHQDIIPMLNFISQDVKLAMDFMFDLRRLNDINLMDIDHDEISFVSRSKRMDIILRVTIKVKQFNKLTSNDISLRCLLGRIKETDVKNLIKNVKRDHKFLRRYMNDVKDYIDIIEETSNLMTE